MKRITLKADEALEAYEAVLADPKANQLDIAHVFSALHLLRCGGPRFLKSALGEFSHRDAGVRTAAVKLVGQIGTVAEAPQLVPLLLDREPMVLYAAANALADIGGPRELIAMNRRLSQNKWIDASLNLRQHVEKCRDRLEKRLDALDKAGVVKPKS